jgi:hypothetical protein
MSEENSINKLRGFHFVLGLIENQQKDLFCSICLSFAKTVENTGENFMKFEKSCTGSKLPKLFCELFEEAHRKLDSIHLPEKPIGQKKEGNCKLPEDICFFKSTYAIYEKIAS